MEWTGSSGSANAERFSGGVKEMNAARPAAHTSRFPCWAVRWVEQHAPSLPETRMQWFARELHRFLDYAKSRASDKLDLALFATEDSEVFRRSEPPMETWQVEQARQAVELFVRAVTR